MIKSPTNLVTKRLLDQFLICQSVLTEFNNFLFFKPKDPANMPRYILVLNFPRRFGTGNRREKNSLTP